MDQVDRCQTCEFAFAHHGRHEFQWLDFLPGCMETRTSLLSEASFDIFSLSQLVGSPALVQPIFEA